MGEGARGSPRLAGWLSARRVLRPPNRQIVNTVKTPGQRRRGSWAEAATALGMGEVRGSWEKTRWLPAMSPSGPLLT